MGVRTAESITGASVFMATSESDCRGAKSFIIARRGGGRRRGMGRRRWAPAPRPRVTLGERPGHSTPSPVLRIKRRPSPEKLSLICGGVGLHFVGARAVETRDGDIQEAKIHGELRAVMDVMV